MTYRGMHIFMNQMKGLSQKPRNQKIIFREMETIFLHCQVQKTGEARGKNVDKPGRSV